MKPSGIGGMAVMEGVMMKNKDVYAVAVRKPNNEIVVEKNTHKDISDKVKLFKLPIFRGILAFIDSMVIGMKVLNYSASFFEEEEEQAQTDKKKKKAEKKNANRANSDDDFLVEEVSVTHSEPINVINTEVEVSKEVSAKEEKSNALLMAVAVLFSLVISISLFMVLPVLITNLFSSIVTNRFLISFIEGIIRLSIFIGYVLLVSRMNEIKRVFMYHGAEHKTINCLENGFELTVENVKWQSKEHKRCGTSFMLLVILISLVFFMILPTGNLLYRILSRVILVPFIAGISYEFIRLAGKSESKIVNIISKPGLWMQGLTTKEPDDKMIEVAIQSVGAVFDWKEFLKTSATPEKPSNSSKQAIAKKQENVKLNEDKKAQNNGKNHEATKKQENIVKHDTASTSEAVKKNDATNKATTATGHTEVRHHNTGAAPITMKPVVPNKTEDEDDEILKALDKFFDNGSKELNRSSETK